ncbi:MAG: hypothetical protein NTX23_05510 [Candidatus Bipolaricaulota bacterium]|nr:hypothetical protein [Candidatus Bipolaricaulota bacterium]
MATGGSVPLQRAQARNMRSGQRLPCVGLAVIVLAMVVVPALGQLSGQFSLDFAARRIPTTLSDDIALDTPSEFAMLEFAIYSNLDVNVDCGFANLKLDMGTNMAGPEHAVGIANLQLAPVEFGGLSFEDIHAIGEMWFAVPFEGVTDVNNLPNCVVILPAIHSSWPLDSPRRLSALGSRHAACSCSRMSTFQARARPSRRSSTSWRTRTSASEAS